LVGRDWFGDFSVNDGSWRWIGTIRSKEPSIDSLSTLACTYLVDIQLKALH
jgi:hypothetical protein